MNSSEFSNTPHFLAPHLALALDSATAGGWEFFPERQHLRCCCQLHRILGEDCSDKEYPLAAWQARIHPEDRAAHAAALQALADGEQTHYTLEYRIRHAGGAWLQVRDRGQRSVLENAQGGLTNLLHGIVTDISQAHQDRLRIARQHRALALLSDIARHAVRATRESDFFVRLREIFTSLGGYQDASILAADLSDASPLVSNEIRLPILIEGKTSAQLRLCFRADNPPDAEEKILLEELAQEISLGIERLRSRAALADNEIALNTLRRALQQSPNSVVITDLHGRIEYVNRHFETISGYSAAESLGRDAQFLAGSNSNPEQAGALWRSIRAGETWEGEFTNQRKDGSNYIANVVASPIRQKDGSTTHYLAIQQDVTERKEELAELARYRKELEQLVAQRTGQYLRAKEQAEAANRAKSAFLANMSHEIRTPMNAIIGLTHLLQRDLSSAPREESEARLGRIDQAAQQLLQLLNDILELSRLEAGIMVNEMQEFSPLGLLQECRSQQLAQASRKGLTLSLQHPLQLPERARSDASSIRQILHQLLTNAIKFTDEGEIRLMVTQDTQADGREILRFSVSDTGLGIDEATQKRLFQPFEQGDASLTRSHGGSGLGLVICRRLIELLKGDIGVDSTPGQGSSFWFTLPLHLPQTQTALTTETDNATVPSDPLDTVNGLNAAAGLHAVRGKRAMYLRLLSTFIHSHGEDFAQMRRLLSAGQDEEARRLAHSIKGAAATLGASTVFESAAAADQAFRQKQSAASILQHIAQAETDYFTLQSALQPILQNNVEQLSAARLDPQALRLHLSSLSKLLHEGDFAVHQRLQKEQEALQQLLGENFRRFQQHIENFDTSAAAALLDEALAALLGQPEPDR